jgi:hypothetical protein
MLVFMKNLLSVKMDKAAAVGIEALVPLGSEIRQRGGVADDGAATG